MVAAVLQTPDTLVTSYLEMTQHSQFRPSYLNDPRVKIIRMDRVDVSFYRFLYSEVGGPWRWRDRLVISLDELHSAIADPNVSVHVLYVDGVPAGYVELSKQGESTEVAYFGLRPDYMGRGYGKHLLSYGIARAWADGAERVFVHTCNLDGPHAMENYLKRGFCVYHTEEKPMPARYTV